MRLRSVAVSVACVLALLGVYYAGYWRGLHRAAEKLSAARISSSTNFEADRLIEPIARSDDTEALLSLHLAMPLEDLKKSDILDTFHSGRAGGKTHEATDIMAPRGTPVHAVEDGSIRKLFLSKAGGKTIYEFDNEGTYCFYYAHLDHYEEGLEEGMPVKKGDVIGFVGSTGNANPNAPHLHFAIYRLGPDKNWWQGTPINPYPILEQLASADH